jgi:hypothetical protein
MKDFVEYQEALELKQLGFDEIGFGRFNNEGDLLIAHTEKYIISNGVNRSEFFTHAPTYSQAFRWFREKYNLEGIPQHAEDRLWYKFHISTYLEYGKKNIYAGFEYPTYEKAEQACLKKLIEIVKENEN